MKTSDGPGEAPTIRTCFVVPRALPEVRPVLPIVRHLVHACSLAVLRVLSTAIANNPLLAADNTPERAR
jgi:hypothetical protein